MAAGDLITLAYLKTYLEAGTGTKRDNLYAQTITAASGAIMDELEREFVTTFGTGDPPNGIGTRTFRWEPGRRRVDLAPFDLQSATSVVLSPEGSATSLVIANGASGVTVDAPDVLFHPIDRPEGVFTNMQISDLVMVRVSNLEFRFGYLDLQITGTWGFPSVPIAVQQACADTAAAWTNRAVAELAIEDYGQGHQDQLLPDLASIYSIPPPALKKLAKFRRFAGIV